MAEKIKIGTISKTHGIAGNLVALFYTDNFESLKEYDKFFLNGKEIKIKFMSKPLLQKYTGDNSLDCIKCVININNIKNIDFCQTFIGKEIFINPNEIIKEEDEFLVSDLIGLEIYNYNEQEDKIGFIYALHDFGAGTIIEIRSDLKEFKAHSMFPFTGEFFPEIDLALNKIWLNSDLI